jgi:ABC-2 type transport system permease protein
VKVWFDEYKNIFKDEGVIMLFIIAILVYPLIYSVAYNNELVKEIPVAIVDESNSEMSRKLISMLDATFEINVTSKTHDFQEAKIAFKESEVHGIIYIPADFEKKILSFETATVSVYADAAYMIIYKQIMTASTYAIGTMSAGIEILRRTAKGNQIEEAYIERDPLPIEVYSLYNPRGGYATYLMPAVLLLILQQTLLLGIGLIGGTLKEKGTQNYIIKIGTGLRGSLAIVFGKSLAYFSIYILNAIYTLVIVMRMFNIPMRGNYLEIFVFITPFIFAVIYMGITISTFFKKREHALMILLFTSIPFIFLSGFSWPTDAIPQWQVWLSEIIPSTPAIKGYIALSQRGAEFSDVFNYWLQLWAILILYLVTSSIFIRRLMKKEMNRRIKNVLAKV